MFKQKQLTVLSMAVLLALLVAAILPFAALADDSAPPPSSDAPVVEEPVVDEPVADTPAMEAPAEDLTVPEILEQLPDGAELLVVDQSGEALPLASVEAAEALAAPDPYFYDASNVKYQFTAADCDPGPATTPCSNPIQAAVDAFVDLGGIGDIIVEGGTYTENVEISGVSNLTGLIGAGSGSTTLDGWIEISDMMNPFTLQGFTIKDVGAANTDGTFVVAEYNTGTLTLNDLVVTNTKVTPYHNYGTGIEVTDHKGDINLTGVISSGNLGGGAYLENRPYSDSTGNITVSSSNFSDNGLVPDENEESGLTARSNGTITLTGVTASGNDGAGAYLHNASSAGFGGITVNSSIFSNNLFDYSSVASGLEAFSNYDITLSGVTASGNDGTGASLDNVGPFGNITVNSSVFSSNTHKFGHGLKALSSHDITLSSVIANDNGASGAYVETDGGSLSVVSGQFNGNKGGDGLSASTTGDITLNKVTANGNKGSGAYLFTFYGSSDPIPNGPTVNCSHFENNGWANIDAENEVKLTLNGVTFGGTPSQGDINFFGTLVRNDAYDCGCGPVGGGEGRSGKKPVIGAYPQVTAIITPLADAKLPGALPNGKTFVASASVKLMLEGKEIEEWPAGVQVTLDIPAGMEPPFTLHSWNGTVWVEVPATVVDGKVVFTVTKPGVFVLVSP